MLFSILDTAIALAKKESATLAAIDARLQSFVAGYLIVDIISEFEKRLEAIFALRVKKLGDVPNANFVASLLDRKFRSPEVRKINEALRNHDASWLIAFDEKLAGTQAKTAMESLVQNRHYYVHKSGTATMSLQDVVQAYGEAVKLFDALAHALGLAAADCAHFT
jgi:hypothetical protein